MASPSDSTNCKSSTASRKRGQLAPDSDNTQCTTTEKYYVNPKRDCCFPSDGAISDLKEENEEHQSKQGNPFEVVNKTGLLSCDLKSLQLSVDNGKVEDEASMSTDALQLPSLTCARSRVDSGHIRGAPPAPSQTERVEWYNCDVDSNVAQLGHVNQSCTSHVFECTLPAELRALTLDRFRKEILPTTRRVSSQPTSSSMRGTSVASTSGAELIMSDCELEVSCSFNGRSLPVVHCTEQLHPELPVNSLSAGCPWEGCTGDGTHHGVYPSDSVLSTKSLTNGTSLHQYRIVVSPLTNLEGSAASRLILDDKSFVFDGFLVLSAVPLHPLPPCELKRFGHSHKINLAYEGPVSDRNVESLTKELLAIQEFIFVEILELYDWVKSLQVIHKTLFITPRFVLDEPGSIRCLLSPVDTMRAVLKVWSPLSISFDSVTNAKEKYSELLVLCPVKVPRCLRVDRVQESQGSRESKIVHFCTRRAQSSFVANKEYQRLLEQYIKLKREKIKGTLKKKDYFRHSELKHKLRELRSKSSLKREVVMELQNSNFLNTGLRADVSRHALTVPVVVHHIRFHLSLPLLESAIGYHFKDKNLLQLALTHPSYDFKYGTTSDHVRNSLTNCGIKRPQVVFETSKDQQRSSEPVNSEARNCSLHNERLEFLGDAIVEYLTTVHLFHIFPNHTEGQLSNHRTALVQNSHLATVAKNLRLQDYILIQHESNLTDEIMDHELANCFEALIGAIHVDSSLVECDKVLTTSLFTEESLRMVWNNFPPHLLQLAHLDGDRFMIDESQHLQKLTLLEEAIGIQFKNICLLAKAFTHSSIEWNEVTKGHNQRLEFFGDAILQYVVSCHLYSKYPNHHEGLLTLMRSSVVNNETLSTVATSLGLQDYVLFDDKQNVPINVKLLADLTESLTAAILLDKGLQFVQSFCEVCILPNLTVPGKEDASPRVPTDPKSQLLQQLIKEQRRNGLPRDLPVYRTINSKGPSHNPVFTVAVYCGGCALAQGDGSSIQSAEKDAARKALINLKDGRYNDEIFK